ncbi:MAG TPA: NRDE family protein [Chloroflexota bacterium]|nr:NRDE family protein [Chloroflexota bacterium]
MCTIITLFQAHPAYPLVIAANRDERYARPSSGPALLDEPRAVVAGRDLDFGGTWFGVNAQGVAVAVADQGLTEGIGNRGRGVVEGDARRPATPYPPSPIPHSPDKRSRGLLVLDALGCPTVGAVSALLASIVPADYNPFTLLHADVRAASIGHHTAGPVQLRTLAPGIDVMVSAIGADHARWRSEYVLGALDPARLAERDAPALRAALQAVLRHHAPPGERDDAICRHREDAGTVSSFVALLAPDLAASQLHCALGAPCRTPYVDYSHLLRALAGAAVRAPGG